MRRLTIAVDPGVSDRFELAIRGLPRSFQRVIGQADVSIISGAPGWTERACAQIEGGSGGVLVGDPVPERVDALTDFADRSGVPIILAPSGAHDPSLVVFRELVPAAEEHVLESRISMSRSQSRSAMSMAHLAMIRSVGAAVRDLGDVYSDQHGFQAVGVLESGRDVLLSLDITDARAPTASLRLVGNDGWVEAQVPMTDRSRPGLVRVVDASGERVSPSSYLTDARVVLGELHESVINRSPGPGLEGFQADLDLGFELSAADSPGGTA